jgi:hypothetical protein
MMQMLSTGYNYSSQMSVSPGTVSYTIPAFFPTSVYPSVMCNENQINVKKGTHIFLNISSSYMREVHLFSTVLLST